MSTPKIATQTLTQKTLHLLANTVPYVVAISVLLYLSLFILNLYFSKFGWPPANEGDYGTFGDFIGGTLNPIFGFTTIMLLVWSLRKQVEELELTRQELKETRLETERSSNALEIQARYMMRDAKLKELNNVLSCQLDMIKETLNTQVFSKNHTTNGRFHATFSDFINYDFKIENYQDEFRNDLIATSKNQTNLAFTALEKQLSQLSELAIEYSKESNNKIYAKPYIEYAKSLINKILHFKESIELKNSLEKLNGELSEH